MRLLILGEPRTGCPTAVNYLGTFRSGPPHVEDLNQDAHLNQLWEWYVDRAYDGETLSEHDVPKATSLICGYAKLGMSLQLVELAPSRQTLCLGRFIGFDVSLCGRYHSLLAWLLETSDRVTVDVSRDPLSRITALARRYFRPKVNEAGLFDDHDTAAFLRDVAVAIDHIEPGYIEGRLDEYELVALGLVDVACG